MAEDMFAYNMVKYSRNVVATKFLSVLKVFMARKDIESVEKSATSYLGIINETCDSLEKVDSVVRELYKKMEVGVTVSHLLVVGDGKTYDYLIKLKSMHGCCHSQGIVTSLRIMPLLS